MRSIVYDKDPYGNTLVLVGGRQLATQVDMSKMAEIIKANGASARDFIEGQIRSSLEKDFNLNLMPEERAQILSELMVQLDEAGRGA